MGTQGQRQIFHHAAYFTLPFLNSSFHSQHHRLPFLYLSSLFLSPFFLPFQMATNSDTSPSSNQELENPSKTLTPQNPPPESTTSQQEDQSLSITVSIDKEGIDSKTKNGDTSQPPNAVVSPTSDGVTIDDVQKKVRRAERFGVPVLLSEKEKRNSRAERFGTTTGSEASKSSAEASKSSSGASKASEELKRKARAERFGLPVSADDEAKKKARLAKFGSDVKTDPVEEEKRKARALRFSQPSSDNVPHIKHGEDVGQKTAVASNGTAGA